MVNLTILNNEIKIYKKQKKILLCKIVIDIETKIDDYIYKI